MRKKLLLCEYKESVKDPFVDEFGNKMVLLHNRLVDYDDVNAFMDRMERRNASCTRNATSSRVTQIATSQQVLSVVVILPKEDQTRKKDDKIELILLPPKEKSNVSKKEMVETITKLVILLNDK